MTQSPVVVRGHLNLDAASLRAWCRDRDIAPTGDAADKLPTGVAPLDRAGPGDIAFCRFEGDDGLRLVNETAAGFLFVPPALAEKAPGDTATILLPTELPRLALLRFLERFWDEPPWTPDMAANPCVHPDAQISPDSRIGPFTVIGPDVEIGPGCVIGSNCHIEHARLAANVTIANNVTIGGTGFGYEDDPQTGEVIGFPHIGGVHIDERVEIGSSTCLDRGSIGDTWIGPDCKIDNLVHVAHNVRMGRGCKVIALAIIGGSVTLGDGAWVAPAAAIRDWRDVGANSVVGLGAVVTKDVPAGETVVGNPARPIARTGHRYK